MLKIKRVKKDDKFLIITIKRPKFRSLLDVFTELDLFFKDENCNFLEPQLSENGKEIILTFILRHKEDILPYLERKGEE